MCCLVFVWKLLEVMFVCDFFCVIYLILELKLLKDLDEIFVKNGSNLLSIVEGEGIYFEKELVFVVFVF